MEPMSHQTKTCPRCNETKTTDKFHKRARSTDGLHIYCKQCRKELWAESPTGKEYGRRYYRKRIAADRFYNRKQKRLLRYGITDDQFLALYDEQNGLCAICNQPETSIIYGQPKTLAIDHDHQSGKVRGLLCSNCNNGLGRFMDDISRLEKAAEYLRRNSAILSPKD